MTRLTCSRKSSARVIVIRRARSAAAPVHLIREGTTGRPVESLPRVWAVAAPGPQRCRGDRPSVLPVAVIAPESVPLASPCEQDSPKPEIAFYRKYTQALLRRYLRLSMVVGRVPSLIGREFFRGNVTHYRVQGFEDIVIFCHDVEKRLEQLGSMDRQLILRVGLQRYTRGEAAAMLGMNWNLCNRQYAFALDRLTEMFLRDHLLEPLKSCQEGKSTQSHASI